MKLIELTRGKFAMVSDEDYHRVNQFSWNANPNDYGCWAQRSDYSSGKCRTVLMHRFITNCPSGMVVDHINHDTLDNRRENLRVCTHSQNSMNSEKARCCRSLFKGVSFRLKNGRTPSWLSRIKVRGKSIHLGDFNSESDASRAYDSAARAFFGEFALLNNI